MTSPSDPAPVAPSGAERTFICELARLPSGEVRDEVVVGVAAGRFTRIDPGGDAPPDAVRLHGLTLPGFANAHSHAFHRALRGRTHRGRGSFWTWRQLMYSVASRLDPDRYRTLATAVFAEMVSAGFTTVGEFHYLHHQAGGVPYSDANEMGEALIAAAREAGIRITLLDTCYLAGGFEEELAGPQRRFGDRDAAAWAARVEDLHGRYRSVDDVIVGAAIHSVRAVPEAQIAEVARWSETHGTPLHAHVSEQPAENEGCLAAYGVTPTALLERAGALGPRTTAVHATHLTAEDIATLGRTRTHACFCPTTERDLADGVGPADRLDGAGAPLTLGTDSHAIVDAFEETRAVELDLRLVTGERGHLSTSTLLEALTSSGQASLGFADAGRLEEGARADLVTVDLRSVRTAGGSRDDAVDRVVYAAAAADVTDVLVDGRDVVRGRVHRLGDVGGLLDEAIAELDGADEETT
jgi:formiminoglutamate deiminase